MNSPTTYAKDMELRDYFAIKILQTMLEAENSWTVDQLETAYKMADLMMEERKK